MSRSTSPSPIEEAADAVGDRWTLLIVDALLDEPRRFGDLEAAATGISTNVLTDRLRRLERVGLVVSRPYSRRPPRFVYELTEHGAALGAAVRALHQWGARRIGTEAASPERHHRSCGGRLEQRWHCQACDALVDDDEVTELRWA